MKKLVFLLITLAVMMLVAVAVMADDTSDLNYMESVRADYMDRIDSEGQTMIFDEIRLVEEGSPYSFPLTVGTGDYEIWGVGGPGMRDLNIRIYSDDGTLLAEDTQTDNYPVLSFSEPVSRSHRVEIEGSEFESGIDQGYYLVIVIRND